jgi:hypothetical protein
VVLFMTHLFTRMLEVASPAARTVGEGSGPGNGFSEVEREDAWGRGQVSLGRGAHLPHGPVRTGEVSSLPQWRRWTSSLPHLHFLHEKEGGCLGRGWGRGESNLLIHLSDSLERELANQC